MASPKRQRQRARRIVQEAAAVTTEVRSDTLDLNEAALRSDGTARIKLIDPGWGSSGYYGQDVLEAAGAARVFPRGTQMFLDHPGATEKVDRPERSVRDLAAVFEGDAVWRNDPVDGPGLYAEAKIFESYRDLIKELAPHIGVSIRASSLVSNGEAEGRRGRIVEQIVEGHSVDFVTKAGRGGQVVAVLEAAGRTDLTEAANIAAWFESRIHSDFTTRADDMYGDGLLTKDERIALSNGIGAALDAFAQTVEQAAPDLLTRDLWTAPDPAATDTTTQEGDMPLTDADLAKVTEVATTVAVEAAKAAVAEAIKPPTTETTTTTVATDEAAATELAEAKARADRAEGALIVEAARRQVAADEKVKALPAVARDRVVEQLAHEAKADDKGQLDTKALEEATAKAVDDEVKYLAEATGSPVRGVGGGDTTAPATTEAVEAATTKLADVFTRLGMTENGAKAAVAGRA